MAPPRAPWAAERGRSVETVSSGGAPPSCSFQKPMCASSTSPLSHSRCHTAKSAYCTGSSGSGEGSPRLKAA